jgi:hypothetical protein
VKKGQLYATYRGKTFPMGLCRLLRWNRGLPAVAGRPGQPHQVALSLSTRQPLVVDGRVAVRRPRFKHNDTEAKRALA